MHSNLVTPPDIVNNDLYSVLLVDPDQPDLDAVIRFCQHSQETFNIYVHTTNMNNLTWISQAIEVCDTVIVHAKTLEHNKIGESEKTYYYGDLVANSNAKKILDPVQFFLDKVLPNK